VPPPPAAIRLITDAGGVCSLAHPGTMRRDDLIPGLVSAGLQAIEVWHPRHDDAQRRHYVELARRHRLVATGGSDFHGGGRGDATVGHQPVPAEVVGQLEARAR
jgi:predicted metal-dependent phosphoesterase TrpH